MSLFGRLLVALLWGFVFANFAQALPAPYNTRIENIANSTFTNALGQVVNLDSNPVVAIVARVPGLFLESAQTRYASPGASFTFPHVITNKGNAPDVFDVAVLAIAASGPGTYAPLALLVYPDTNNDGLPDNFIPITTTPLLAAGASFNVIVVGQVPNTTVPGQIGKLAVTARTNAAYAASQAFAVGAPVTNTDTLVVTSRAVITTTKRLNISSGPAPNSNGNNHLVFRIDYINTGATAATNVEILDTIGAAGSGYNSSAFTYIPGTANWNGIPLTDIVGVDAPGINYEFGISQPKRLRAVIAQVPPFGKGYIEFKVDVLGGFAAGNSQSNNLAQVNFHDGANTLSVQSNRAAYFIESADARPDLVVDKVAVGPNTLNRCSIFELKVKNIGQQASAGLITVNDFLPNGLVYEPSCSVGAQVLTSGGTNWTCTGESGASIVRCTSNITVPGAVSGVAGVHPNLLKVVARSVPAQLPSIPTAVSPTVVINRAVISGGSEPTAFASNNQTQAPVTVGLGATVRGMVWVDTNHDRRFNAGDRPLADWVVEALKDGVLFGTIKSDAQGRYAIVDLPPGVYQIRFRDPSSNIVNGRPVCNERGLDSNVVDNCNRTSVSNLASKRINNDGALEVNLVSGDTVIEQSLPLDPSGVVYDSLTRKPVAGAHVLIQTPVGLDPVLHIIGGASSLDQITGPDGFYQFLLTADGGKFCAAQPNGGCDFNLKITVPPGYNSGPSAIILPRPSFGGGCSYANCIDPTGLAPAGVAYSVNSANLNEAPPVGQPVEYYFAFRLSPGDPDVVNNHIPIDPIAAIANRLLIEKTAEKESVEIGDSIGYAIKIKNPVPVAINNVEISDQLPVGFVYEPGTARLSGAPIADPPTRGPVLRFVLGSIVANGVADLSYRLRPALGAKAGDAINRAQAFGAGLGGTVTSNVSSAKVKVLAGVFTDRAIVVGKVYLDCDQNARQNLRDRDDHLTLFELGIPGVRVVLDNGTYAITDEEGKYSLYGIAPRSYALKLDTTSLPANAILHSIDNRNRGDGSLRYLDPKNGELVRGDFAVNGCSPDVVALVQERRSALKKLWASQAEVSKQMGKDFNFEAPVSTLNDARARPSTGKASDAVSTASNTAAQNGLASKLKPASSEVDKTPTTARAIFAAQKVDFDEWLPSADAQLAFINTKDGQTVPERQITIQVKGALDMQLELSVNGQAVAVTRIGKRSTLEDKQVQALEFVSVTLNEGSNTLTVSEKDVAGIARNTRSITLRAPGDFAKLQWVLPEVQAKADSLEPILVKVLLQDKDGTPVNARTALTLELVNSSQGASPAAIWLEQDLDPVEPGMQLFVQDGVGVFKLRPPQQAGDVQLIARSGGAMDRETVKFYPNLRPLLAAGIVEGAINLRKLSASQLSAGRSADSFEQEIRRWSRSGGDTSVGVRGSLYLKGEVKGEHLLTLAYDSDRDLRERLFRDISPDEHYPIYGDSSEKGWDAQSSQRLYVRVDKNKSWLLYGDYSSRSNDPGPAGMVDARQLAGSSRSLTGLKWHYEDDLLRVNAHTSRDTLRQYTQEIRANGTSGPYPLLGAGGGAAVLNGERVEIITRDRNQLGVILKTEALVRFADYAFETFDGQIIFKAPVVSFDSDLNPRFIRVSYEVDQGGEAFWIAGLDGSVALGENMRLGASLEVDRNPLQPLTVAGINLSWKIDKRQSLALELARSDRHGVPSVNATLSSGVAGTGNGARVQYRFDGDTTKAGITVARTDAEFDNPNSSVGRGRQELKAEASQKINASNVLSAEASSSHDLVQANQRSSMALRLESGIGASTRLTTSIKRTQEEVTAVAGTAPQTDKIDTISMKLAHSIAALPGASVFGEVEQALGEESRKAVTVGGEYKFKNGVRLYGRHELTSSLRKLDNPLSDNRQATVVGAELPWADNSKAFTEYRARDGVDGVHAEAAMGLRQTWKINDEWRVSGNFETVRPLSAAAQTVRSSAISLGAEYLTEDSFKSTTRLELRKTDSGNSWLFTQGLAKKYSDELTGLARLYVSEQENSTTPNTDNTSRIRLLAGAAWRDQEVDDFNALAKMELRLEKSPLAATPFQRRAWIASVHTNQRFAGANTLSQHWAIKRAYESYAGLDSTRFTAGLGFLRYTHHLNSHWDLDVHGGLMVANNLRHRQWGLGLEVGYLLQDDLWLSLGYNHFGFVEPDLAGADYTQQGLYVRLRWKFDENVFKKKSDGQSGLSSSVSRAASAQPNP